MLDHITPVILTFNEAPNIARVLDRLAWAREVIVVDSGSTDETCAIVAGRPRTRLVSHPFASHAEQWRFAIEETGVTTAWILRLDADYVLTPEAVEELSRLRPDADLSAFRAPFLYCIRGRTLRASMYPPNFILFRRGRASPYQDGHTERWRIDGQVGELMAPILHDDRKPISAWIAAQDQYMALESAKLMNAETSGGKSRDRLRRHPGLAALAVFVQCLFVKGLLLDGQAGLYYALQRATAELILSLHLLDRKLKSRQ